MSSPKQKEHSTAEERPDTGSQPSSRPPSIILNISKQSKAKPASPKLVREDAVQYKELNIENIEFLPTIPTTIEEPEDSPISAGSDHLWNPPLPEFSLSDSVDYDDDNDENATTLLPLPSQPESSLPDFDDNEGAENKENVEFHTSPPAPTESSSSDYQSNNDEEQSANYLVASRQLLLSKLKRDSTKQPRRSSSYQNLRGIRSRSSEFGVLTPDNKIAGTAGYFDPMNSDSTYAHRRAAITDDPLDRHLQRVNVHRRHKSADPLTHEWMLGEAGLIHRSKLVINIETAARKNLVRLTEEEIALAEAEAENKRLSDQYSQMFDEADKDGQGVFTQFGLTNADLGAGSSGHVELVEEVVSSESDDDNNPNQWQNYIEPEDFAGEDDEIVDEDLFGDEGSTDKGKGKAANW